MISTSVSNPRIRLVSKRVQCGWGMFGLVEAVFNALQEAEADETPFDYAILLSEACLPTRPIAHLERFLRENPLDYIETMDQSWIMDGLRDERHRWYFPFNFQTQPKLSRLSNALQSSLRVKRRFPSDLEPRFGSQWWALRRTTCRSILDYWRKNPRTIEFFRSVWIPDEMVFQTLVAKLVPSNEIAQRSLTFVRFTDRGKPVVYFDDHIDYVLSAPRFFIRKVKEAKHLRAACLECAAAGQLDYTPPPLSEAINSYELRRISNTWFPKAGQVFYRNQYNDDPRGIIEALERRNCRPLRPGSANATHLALFRR